MIGGLRGGDERHFLPSSQYPGAAQFRPIQPHPSPPPPPPRFDPLGLPHQIKFENSKRKGERERTMKNKNKTTPIRLDLLSFSVPMLAGEMVEAPSRKKSKSFEKITPSKIPVKVWTQWTKVSFALFSSVKNKC